MKPFFVSALILAAPTAAQTTQAGPAAQPEKKVCRMMESATGSHFPGRRVCRTKSEWEAVDAANAEGARALSDRAVRSGSINE